MKIKVLLLVGVALVLPVLGYGQEIDFNRDVRPILSRHCIACHGPDPEHREAGYRIDVRDEALAAIEPGNPDESEIIYRITSEDDDRMPPAEHSDALSNAEIQTLKAWVEQGAKYAKHWAFEKPKSTHSKHASIDFFVGQALRKKGMEFPSEEAEPSRLIRRVALDLTGLPPSREMVARYQAAPDDKTFESIVDELLASPRYGEHWTGMWLDLARYADTTGYASDQNRTIWPWRDWVIRAFDENMPFDQFTIEQIAGDLLPDATQEQILATAFHRNTLNNTEGGTSDEEFRTIAVKDRINTTVNVWMGLTMRCAECHTHKYDPISQKEYYQFLDFFNQTADADKNDFRPTMEIYPDGHKVDVEAINQRISNLKTKMKGAEHWKPLQPLKAQSSLGKNGASLEILEDDSVVAKGANPEFDVYQVDYELGPGSYTGFRLEALPDANNKNNVGRHPNGSFALSQLVVELFEGGNSRQLKFSDADAEFTQGSHQFKFIIGEAPHPRGWAVGHPTDGYRKRRFGALKLGQKLELANKAKIRVTLTHSSNWQFTNVGRFRISATEHEKPLAAIKAIKRTANQIARLEKQKSAGIKVPVMQELAHDKKRTTHVMTRGSYLQPSEKVEADVFEAFHPLPEDSQKNRLAVANWLVSKENPLTARVTVNRFWARIFGRGLVETEEDFGTQGTAPSHPELLDWLAIDFQENGWDVKRLLKQMVLSKAYRQTGLASKTQLEKDPNNVWLSRGPRFRLRAEVIRDQALAVSGLLSQKKFGPPVYPPNPVKSVRSAFQGAMVWKESQGEDRYRRALYTYIKRSSPHPLFDTFDMATREVCNMRRIRTNTPLQSFMTLNDQAFIEAAQTLAQKMLAASDQAEGQIEAGFEAALFRKPTEKQRSQLVALFETTHDEFLEDSESAKQMAGTENESTSELAALTVVANVILNLDAFLTK